MIILFYENLYTGLDGRILYMGKVSGNNRTSAKTSARTETWWRYCNWMGTLLRKRKTLFFKTNQGLAREASMIKSVNWWEK